MNKIEIDNYYEPESKTIRLDEADLNQIDTNTMQILLKENYKLKKENQKLKDNWNKQKEVIDKANDFIKKYSIPRAYYNYIDDDGCNEYIYDEDFKEQLLKILNGEFDEK